ncbi:MAG: cytochrome c family protein [Deferribacteraceae bacterium]|nr:cytochrome c family protein [Deferribacteraceae bacterium]
MKKLIVMFFMFSFLFALVAVAQENKGPETINLKESWKVEGKKEAVVFNHALHQDPKNNNTCTSCHATEEGGKFVPAGEIKGANDKNPAHANCWPCHLERKTSVGKTCTKCHVKAK